MRRVVLEGREESVEDAYRGLTLPRGERRPWVAVGMVSSLDGATTVEGRTAGLGGAADAVAFRALRDACDAVLVGAGTVRAEGYGPPTGTARRRSDRRRRGLAEVPALVIVSGSLDLDPAHRVFSDPAYPPLVVTTTGASPERVDVLGPVAEVVTVGDTGVDPHMLLDLLHVRGLQRVLCEGGPALNGALAAADRVDEVFLTVAPTVVGSDSARAFGAVDLEAPHHFQLHELHEHDGELLLRYRRRRRC